MPGAEIFCHADGSGDVDAAGSAETQAFFLKQVEHDGKRFFVGDAIGIVDGSVLEISGDSPLPAGRQSAGQRQRPRAAEPFEVSGDASPWAAVSL